MMIMQSPHPRRIKFAAGDDRSRHTLARVHDLAYHPRRKPKSGESWTGIGDRRGEAYRDTLEKCLRPFAHQPHKDRFDSCDARFATTYQTRSHHERRSRVDRLGRTSKPFAKLTAYQNRSQDDMV